jgi:hypothetical protein
MFELMLEGMPNPGLICAAACVSFGRREGTLHTRLVDVVLCVCLDACARPVGPTAPVGV